MRIVSFLRVQQFGQKKLPFIDTSYPLIYPLNDTGGSYGTLGSSGLEQKNSDPGTVSITDNSFIVARGRVFIDYSDHLFFQFQSDTTQ
jgi:hypothetical protein